MNVTEHQMIRAWRSYGVENFEIPDYVEVFGRYEDFVEFMEFYDLTTVAGFTNAREFSEAIEPPPTINCDAVWLDYTVIDWLQAGWSASEAHNWISAGYSLRESIELRKQAIYSHNEVTLAELRRIREARRRNR